MKFMERALTFDCGGEVLVGILAEPLYPIAIGVLVLVGGPQYRVGSHRQFVSLSRQLAAHGVTAMRFDYRGMGDSTGSPVSFDETSADIAAAIDTMRASCPTIRQVVLWGLCDAASAALTYWHETHDRRVVGMVLLNPWVRSERSIARTRIKHYYARRFLQREFWLKLASRGVDVGQAFREVSNNMAAWRKRQSQPSWVSPSNFQDRMATGLRSFDGPILLILSGRDLTAKEFLDYAKSHSLWDGLLDRPQLARHEIDDADHTFSSDRWRQEIEALTFEWLSRSFSRR